VDGRGLRELRRSLDVKLQKVARAIGRSPTWLWYVENGVLVASAEELSRIEAVLRAEEEFPIPAAKPRRRKPIRCIE
jgi:transcriptional regulator with XRE-family HTH domain